MKPTLISLSAGLIALAAGRLNGAEIEGVTFESLARDADVTSELGMLVAPFVDDCRQSKREIDRVRCEGVRTSLLSQLAAEKVMFVREGADAVVVSGYDGRTHSVRLVVLGCLACKQPVEVSGERRFVTLTAPTKSASVTPVAAELFRTSVAFKSAADAEAWRKTVKPNLRVELVFRAVGEPWTVGGSRGVAFKPLGVRISNRCTGQVVASQPPSRGPASHSDNCETPAEGADDTTSDDDDRPETLGTAQINDAIAGSRKDLDLCVSKFKVAGTAAIDFVVAKTGVPQSVTVGGSAAGTALSECLVDVASRIRFPAFRGETQRFRYPLILRR